MKTLKTKKGLLILLATILTGACTNQTNKTAIRLPLSVNLSEVTYKGHEYLMNYRGGIIHSESCSCKDTLKLTTIQEEDL